MPVAAPLFRLVYRSQAAAAFTRPELPELLHRARLKNQQHLLTGLLLYAGHQFMQVLEGPEPALSALYSTIQADPRHTSVHMLSYEPIEIRAFPDWRMAFAPTDAVVLEQATGYLRLAAVPGFAAHPPQVLWQLLRHFAQLESDQPDM
jgi:Sensors of blue-light using FAD